MTNFTPEGLLSTPAVEGPIDVLPAVPKAFNLLWCDWGLTHRAIPGKSGVFQASGRIEAKLIQVALDMTNVNTGFFNSADVGKILPSVTIAFIQRSGDAIQPHVLLKLTNARVTHYRETTFGQIPWGFESIWKEKDMPADPGISLIPVMHIMFSCLAMETDYNPLAPDATAEGVLATSFDYTKLAITP